MIGAEELAAMRPDAHLLNFACGAVIDQDALIDALKAVFAIDRLLTEHGSDAA